MRSSGAPAKTGEPLYGSSVSSFLRPPMLKIEPALPMQRMLPALPMLKIEPALPMLKMEPALPMLSTLKILPTLPTLNKLPVPNKPAPLLAAPRATLRFRPERVALRIPVHPFVLAALGDQLTGAAGYTQHVAAESQHPLRAEELPDRLLGLHGLHWVLRPPVADATFES